MPKRRGFFKVGGFPRAGYFVSFDFPEKDCKSGDRLFGEVKPGIKNGLNFVSFRWSFGPEQAG